MLAGVDMYRSNPEGEYFEKDQTPEKGRTHLATSTAESLSSSRFSPTTNGS